MPLAYAARHARVSFAARLRFCLRYTDMHEIYDVFFFQYAEVAHARAARRGSMWPGRVAAKAAQRCVPCASFFAVRDSERVKSERAVRKR